MLNAINVVFALCFVPFTVDAFVPSIGPKLWHSNVGIELEGAALFASRRSFVESFSITSVIVGSSLLLSPIEEANASGGATAGGVYLQSVRL